MKTYLNWKGPGGLETVDEFERGVDAPTTRREFWEYVLKQVKEYHEAGMIVYVSGRPCKNWK